jgi:hypothetical protein
MQAIDSGTLAGGIVLSCVHWCVGVLCLIVCDSVSATSEMLGWLSNNAAGMIDFHTQQLNYWKVCVCVFDWLIFGNRVVSSFEMHCSKFLKRLTLTRTRRRMNLPL